MKPHWSHAWVASNRIGLLQLRLSNLLGSRDRNLHGRVGWEVAVEAGEPAVLLFVYLAV